MCIDLFNKTVVAIHKIGLLTKVSLPILTHFIIKYSNTRNIDMYKYESSWVRSIKSNVGYTTPNLLDTKLKTIVDTYIDGYIELSHPGLARNVYLEVTKILQQPLPISLEWTLKTWLGKVGNRTIAALSDKPNYEKAQVLARDAILSEFNVDLAEPNKLPHSDASVGNKRNLYVTLNASGAQLLKTRCLTTVNGMLHRNYSYDKGIQVVEGGHSMLHAKSNNTGIISFEHIGDIRQIPITEDIVNKYTPATPYTSKVVLDLSMSLVGKSVLISLGGFLLTDLSTVTVVSEENGLIQIDTSGLDVTERLLSSRKLIDLSEHGLVDLDPDDLDFGKMRLADITSDLSMLTWFTLPQSFVIVVDTPTLTIDKVQTQVTGLYGVYEYHENPYYPLVDHYGRMPEYWVKQQNDAWIIQIHDPVYKPRITRTTNINSIQFSNETMPYHSLYRYPLSMLKIQSVKLVE